MSKEKTKSRVIIAECLNCGSKFEKKREWHVFCKTKCRLEYWRNKKLGNKRLSELEKRMVRIEKQLGINQ